MPPAADPVRLSAFNHKIEVARAEHEELATLLGLQSGGNVAASDEGGEKWRELAGVSGTRSDAQHVSAHAPPDADRLHASSIAGEDEPKSPVVGDPGKAVREKLAALGAEDKQKLREITGELAAFARAQHSSSTHTPSDANPFLASLIAARSNLKPPRLDDDDGFDDDDDEFIYVPNTPPTSN